MPLQRCQFNSNPGWKFGKSGKCFTGPNGKERAAQQGAAIKISQSKKDADEFRLNLTKNRVLLMRNALGENPLFPSKNRLRPSATGINPHMISTKSIELSYFRALRNLIQPLFDITQERIFPDLKNITAQRKKEITIDQSSGQMITNTFEGIKIQVGEIFPEEETRDLAQGFAETISRFNSGELDKQFVSVLGVNPLRSEPYLVPEVENFVETNVSLIQSIPEKFLSDIQTIIRTGVENGESNTTLQNKIFQRFGVTRNRAALIAADQVGKFFGKLNELRQKESGISSYIWQTAEDERVRPALGLSPKQAAKVVSHRKLNEKIISWEKPPVSGVRGERQHPGIPIRCRCIAIPNFNDILTIPLLSQIMLPFAR